MAELQVGGGGGGVGGGGVRVWMLGRVRVHEREWVGLCGAYQWFCTLCRSLPYVSVPAS